MKKMFFVAMATVILGMMLVSAVLACPQISDLSLFTLSCLMTLEGILFYRGYIKSVTTRELVAALSMSAFVGFSLLAIVFMMICSNMPFLIYGISIIGALVAGLVSAAPILKHAVNSVMLKILGRI
jgi:hypothetical protein